MLAKQYRFTPPAHFTRSAQRYNAGVLTVFWKPSDTFGCGVSITKRNCSLAVGRNRIKRQIFQLIEEIYGHEPQVQRTLLIRVKGVFEKSGLTPAQLKEARDTIALHVV